MTLIFLFFFALTFGKPLNYFHMLKRGFLGLGFVFYTNTIGLVFPTYFKIIQMYVKITNNMVFCSFLFVDVFLEVENWDFKRLRYVPTFKSPNI
jgi:hypothetical protein